MRKLLIALAALVVLVVAGIVALPFLVPVEAVVARLEREVAERTGRTLEIAGPVEVSVLPDLAVTAADVRFAGQGEGAHLLRLGRLDLQLGLLPLLSGQVRVDRFVLVAPVLALEVDRKGRPNWQVGPATAPTAPGTETQATGALPQDLALGDVEIVDGVVTYADARTGTVRRITDIDATIALRDLAAPLEVEARLIADGRPLSAGLRLAPARAVLDRSGAADLTAVLEAAGSRMDLAGRFDGSGERPAVVGDLSLKVPSLAALAALATGAERPAFPAESLELTGRLQSTPDRAAFDGLKLALDDLQATGTLAIGLTGQRPSLSGKLALGRVDLDRWLPAPGTSPTPAAGPAAGQPAPSDPVGWSRTPIDLSPLKRADIDLDITVAGVTAGGVEAGPTSVAIDLNGGKLAGTLAETALFGGKVSGAAEVDARASQPTWRLRTDIAGVQAEPLLQRFAGSDRLIGTMDATADLRMAGASVFDLVRSLDGQGRMLFRDGAVRGINIAALVRSVTGGAAQADAPLQTDFAELGAGFTIADGTATTEDLRLLAPLLRVAGSGRVTLPERTVDMRIVPRLVASIEGQGAAKTDQEGLAVPILVRGPFDNLSYTPDLGAVAREAARNPEALKQQVQGVRDAVKGVTGGASAGQGGAEAAAGKLLQGLFGRKPQPEPAPSESPPQPAQ